MAVLFFKELRRVAGGCAEFCTGECVAERLIIIFLSFFLEFK